MLVLMRTMVDSNADSMNQPSSQR